MILGRIARTTMTTTGVDGMAGTLARAMAATLTTGLVVGAALSGCQGQDSANPPPPTFATPTAITPTAGTPTDSPTDGATRTDSAEIPAAARANTAAGAEAFARFYFGRLNEAFTNPPRARLDDLATKQCTSCANLTRNVGLFGAAHVSTASFWSPLVAR